MVEGEGGRAWVGVECSGGLNWAASVSCCGGGVTLAFELSWLMLRVRFPSNWDDSMARSGITREGVLLPSGWDGMIAGLGPDCLAKVKQGIELPSTWDGMAAGLGKGPHGGAHGGQGIGLPSDRDGMTAGLGWGLHWGVNEEAQGYKLIHLFSGLLQLF